MGVIDFPLTDGVHEENDNKLGKPSTLIRASNFYYQLIGRLAVRGGFQGTANDSFSTGANGTPRDMTEADGSLAIVTDKGVVFQETYAVNIPGMRWSTGCYLAEDTPLPLPSSVNAAGGTVANSGTASEYWKDAENEYVACGGALFTRATLYPNTGWTRIGSYYTGAAPFSSLAGMTTGSGAGVVAVMGDSTAAGEYKIFYGSTQLATGALPAISGGGCCLRYGTGDAIVGIISGTNIYIYFVRGNSFTLKNTYAHGSAGPVNGLHLTAVGTTLWAAWYDGNTKNIEYRKFAIPADPTGAWTSAPAATGAVSTSGTVYFDVTSDGYMLYSNTVTTSGSAGVTTHKYNMNASAEVLWNTPLGYMGNTNYPTFVPVSKIFSPNSDGYYYVFAICAPYPEYSNALCLVRFFAYNAALPGDGDCISVSSVQETPVSALLAPSWGTWQAPVPFLDSDGSITLIHHKALANGTTRPFLGKWQLSVNTAATPRNVTSGGSLVIASASTHEVSAEEDSFTICPMWVWGLAAVAGATSLAAGTYSVRALVETETDDGTWQSAATLPKSVTITAGQQIGANVTLAALAWRKSSTPYRVVFYVAPPGSTTYYRSLVVESERDGAERIQTLNMSVSTTLITSVDTTAEILYELVEPARAYPGDAVGTSYANGRFWRWNGFRLWFSHAVSAGYATQWAGDVFRIDFNGDVQGVGQLQGQPLVITAEGVYLLGGDGPDRTGAGSYDVRQLASVPLGCLDQRSVVETPIGTMWSSCRGIELVSPGGGPPVSIGQPVRETYDGTSEAFAPGGFVLGAHCQSRSLAIWMTPNANTYILDNVIVFDYLRGVWTTWNVPTINGAPLTAAGSWGKSFAYFTEYNGTTWGSYDCRYRDGAVSAVYPLYSSDSVAGTGGSGQSATLETGDVRVAGSNANAMWNGVWLLGDAGRQGMPNGTYYELTQTADGVAQTTQLFPGPAKGWFRSMGQFPISDADGVSIKIKITLQDEFYPNYVSNGGPPSITALSFDYTPTGNLSLLGSGSRS